MGLGLAVAGAVLSLIGLAGAGVRDVDEYALVTVVLNVVVKAVTGILIPGGPLTRPVNEHDRISGAILSKRLSA